MIVHSLMLINLIDIGLFPWRQLQIVRNRIHAALNGKSLDKKIIKFIFVYEINPKMHEHAIYL